MSGMDRFWDSQEKSYEIIIKIKIKWSLISLNFYYMSALFLNVLHALIYLILTVIIRTFLILQMKKWTDSLLGAFLQFVMLYPFYDSKECFQNQHSKWIAFFLLQFCSLNFFEHVFQVLSNLWPKFLVFLTFYYITCIFFPLMTFFICTVCFMFS